LYLGSDDLLCIRSPELAAQHIAGGNKTAAGDQCCRDRERRRRLCVAADSLLLAVILGYSWQ
jgi:hypothetical protein